MIPADVRAVSSAFDARKQVAPLGIRFRIFSRVLGAQMPTPLDRVCDSRRSLGVLLKGDPLSEPLSHGPSVRRTGSPTPRTSRNSVPAETAERLLRLAELAAIGEATLDSLPDPAERSIVLAKVAELRRKRLVRYLARAIAQDFYGDAEQIEKVPDHA